MDVRHIASVRYLKAPLLGVAKENSEKPLLLLVIGRRLWSGNPRTQI